MDLSQTLGTKCVPTMYQNMGYFFTNVKFITTVIAKIEAPSFVVSLYKFTIFSFPFFFCNSFLFFLVLCSPFFQIHFLSSRLWMRSISVFSFNLLINFIEFFVFIWLHFLLNTCLSIGMRLLIHFIDRLLKFELKKIIKKIIQL